MAGGALAGEARSRASQPQAPSSSWAGRAATSQTAPPAARSPAPAAAPPPPQRPAYSPPPPAPAQATTPERPDPYEADQADDCLAPFPRVTHSFSKDDDELFWGAPAAAPVSKEEAAKPKGANKTLSKEETAKPKGANKTLSKAQTSQVEKWAFAELEKITGSDDTTLAEFLLSLHSASEVTEYVVEYLGADGRAFADLIAASDGRMRWSSSAQTVTEYAVEYLGADGRAFAEELAFRKQMGTEQ
ncbi:hypothetical protein T484DRAFT_1813164, partial [Baffinella frigidus]